VKLVFHWLRELADVPEDPEVVATQLGLRGFEVASVESDAQPVIDFEITANRPDCLSHIGLAREAAAIWGHPLRLPDATPAATQAEAQPSDCVDVTIEDAVLCPRYCAQVFEVRIGPSPSWLADRLTAAGVRPINNIVDITNYVMLELGQPMHAFDLERVGGRALIIRRARAGEKLRTLDGVDRTLEPDMLVIADAERASAIGGVMGGQDSEIGGKTTRIVLESAYFQPATIRRTSRRLGLKTEASSRFERGGDINAPPAGIARAASLFRQVGAGTPIGSLIDRYPSPRVPVQIRLRAARISRLLGQEVPAQDVPRYLRALGFGVEPADGGWQVTVPTFRVDVTREVDLIEEVARHHGFDRLPVTFPSLAAPQGPPDPRIVHDRLLRQVLTSSGFSESMTFAFIERQAAVPFMEEDAEPAAIANPLSEKFAVLRPSLLAGLIDSCAHNRRRGRKDVRLFEIGSRFTAAGEGRTAAFLWCGATGGPHWSGGARAVDFFDAKGAVEVLCAAFGILSPDVTPAERGYLVRGRAAEVRAGGTLLGVVGQLAPAIAEARGLPDGEPLYVAEIDSDALARVAGGDDLRAESLPRFPSIVRDLSILVDAALPAAALRGTIRSSGPSTLASIVEFDRYQGGGVPDGRVSLSLRLTFRAAERTLTDEEAHEAVERIVETLRATHGAERR